MYISSVNIVKSVNLCLYNMSILANICTMWPSRTLSKSVGMFIWPSEHQQWIKFNMYKNFTKWSSSLLKFISNWRKDEYFHPIAWHLFTVDSFTPLKLIASYIIIWNTSRDGELVRILLYHKIVEDYHIYQLQACIYCTQVKISSMM